MQFQAQWIRPSEETGDVCPVFRKKIQISGNIKKAELYITSLGVYEAVLNGRRVGEYVLAPGWTAYDHRIQYQCYDVTEMLDKENTLEITVGKGWYASPMPGWNESVDKIRRKKRKTAVFAELHLIDEDGKKEIYATDHTWQWAESRIRFSEIYDGEICDATVNPAEWKPVRTAEGPTDLLIPQEGEEIREKEIVSARTVFTTPSGETVVDFGQEVTGYVEIRVNAHAGDRVRFLHGEVLDREGNFYRDNYRSAKAEAAYICSEGQQTWHPALTFFGFRYIKLLEFPGEAKPENFRAIVVYSDIRQTGQIRCGRPEIDQLISNIFWGQKSNFLDVPTDCPQRDERLGWTGDAQVFVRTAGYNYDVEKFFRKWLRDLKADQRPDGSVGQVIPDYMPEEAPSAAWGDAAVICPWQIYETYGNEEVLKEQFDSMKKWVDYITSATEKRYLWTGGVHFGDWLGLDAPSGSYKGSSREDFIASAFYACSTELVIKAGRVIGADVSGYEQLYRNIVETFRKEYPEYRTQTEHILAIRFGLAEDPGKTADALADMIRRDGIQMRTGFVGTPYILHVLSDYGHEDLAYSLLLRKEYPSWLYSVGKGATTIWEHWDGIMENGEFWSTDMNSFNHYAYGSVVDWLYEKAAGIMPALPGFEKAVICPHPDKRLGWMDAEIDTRHGKIRSYWCCEKDTVRYELWAEMPVTAVIDGKKTELEPGKYTFWGNDAKQEKNNEILL